MARAGSAWIDAPGIDSRVPSAPADIAGALVFRIRWCSSSKSARHEPMIQPYLHDPEVNALPDKLDARRAGWRKVLPKSSMRVPIPGIDDP
jgi:hypothetical protein